MYTTGRNFLLILCIPVLGFAGTYMGVFALLSPGHFSTILTHQPLRFSLTINRPLKPLQLKSYPTIVSLDPGWTFLVYQVHDYGGTCSSK